MQTSSALKSTQASLSAADLRACAADVRAFLQGIWPIWHQRRCRDVPSPVSMGTCQTSSLFLVKVLQQQGVVAQVVQGNAPGEDQGFFDGAYWRGHAWVECHGFIIDVTADQFGADPVIVTSVGDGRYREGADTANQNLRAMRDELASDALRLWNDSRNT